MTNAETKPKGKKTTVAQISTRRYRFAGNARNEPYLTTKFGGFDPCQLILIHNP